jgi:serine phosphatase RsbU (regulator of sigma subunit)
MLAPFRGLVPSLSIAILDASGACVGGTTDDAAPRDALSRPIVAGPLAGGWVVAWGPSASTSLAVASVESMAIALGIAHTAGGAGIADVGAARRIEEELAHGRRLQRSFVSLVAPEVPGYELASHYEAAREVGGDFFDLFRMRRRGRPLSIVIADVSGKGIAAALLMAFSRPLIHAAIDNTIGPAAALERTNHILVQERRSSLFITALCATLALPTGRLRLANAGHEPPLIVPGDGSPILPVNVEGPLLGAFGSLGLFEAEVELGGGDVVLFYTDGVTDARSASGERFEETRLLAAIEAARRQSGDGRGAAAGIVASIRAAVTDFQAGVAPADDITIVALGRRRPVIRRGRSPRRSPSAAEG